MPYIFLSALALLLAVGLFKAAAQQRPMSIIDEHIHLDNAFKLHDGNYPDRGSLLGQELVEEWACGVGHEAGDIPKSCDDVTLSAEDVPSGKYTSGYIHYPTYFLMAEGMRTLVDAVSEDTPPVSAYRMASALFTTLGVAACAVMAGALGLRRSGLIGATLAPVAAASVVGLGIIVNPGSTAILTGALIAGTGLGWMLRGWSFWWLAGSTALAAGIAVTNSLPAGTFLLAALVAVIGQATGWRLNLGRWSPRWYHPAVLTAIVLAPVIVWGRHIRANATVDNDVLYGFAGFEHWRQVWIGAVSELTSLHTPWYDTELAPMHDNLLTRLPHAASNGAPAMLSILLIGGGVAILIKGRFQRARPRLEPESPTETDALSAVARQPAAERSLIVLATACLLAVLFLYPPALRIYNAISVGFDYPITSRYSIAFMPLITLLALLAWRARTYHALVAFIGSVGVLGLAAVGF